MSVLIKGIDLPEAYTSAWLTVFECVGEHTFIKTHKVSAEQMQAIPPHGRWIPCSERLPKQGQEVICQCRARIIKVLKLDAGGNWYQDASHCYMRGFVIAWMPLPEPYKAEEVMRRNTNESEIPM